MGIDSRIITLHGALLNTANKLDPLTIQHARDILKDSQIDESLLKKGFWTGDFPLYTLENNEVVLYLANRENNLIFKDLKTSMPQLMKNHNYFPKDSDIKNVIKSSSTLKTKLSDLELKEYLNEWTYYTVYTASREQNKEKNYDTLNPLQRLLAEKIYGVGENFSKTMLLYNSKANIRALVVYVLNPNYVKENLDNKIKGLARVAYLNNYESGSEFKAGRWGVDRVNRYIRGMTLDKQK